MPTYNVNQLKNRDFIVDGNNKKILPYKNSFNAKQLTAGELTIVATDDARTVTGTTTGATNVINVLANDTVGGVAAIVSGTSNVILTTVTPNANLRLNANGSVDVLNPTANGTYALTYKICQKNRPSNCDTATVTITVA